MTLVPQESQLTNNTKALARELVFAVSIYVQKLLYLYSFTFFEYKLFIFDVHTYVQYDNNNIVTDKANYCGRSIYFYLLLMRVNSVPNRQCAAENVL